MSDLLLDSHIFLWLLQEPDKIGQEAMKHITMSERSIFVSAATIWELGLKYQKGKLRFNAEQLLKAVQLQNTKLLPITTQHIITTHKLNIVLSDPFDCLLLAQAKYEELSLLTADRAMLKLQLPFVRDAKQ